MITLPIGLVVAVLGLCVACLVIMWVVFNNAERAVRLMQESAEIRTRYYEALCFYADPDTWEWESHPPSDFAGERFDASEPDQAADSDRGDIARQALQTEHD